MVEGAVQRSAGGARSMSAPRARPARPQSSRRRLADRSRSRPRSVPGRPLIPPSVSIRVPEVLTKGLPDPSSASRNCLDRAHVGGHRVQKRAGAHSFVVERQVDDAVGRSGRLAQAVEIVQVAAMNLGASVLQRRGGAVRTGQTDHLMAGSEQFGDDGGTDRETSMSLDVIAFGSQSERRPREHPGHGKPRVSSRLRRAIRVSSHGGG